MRFTLPTQPDQPQAVEEGANPPPGIQNRRSADNSRANADTRSWPVSWTAFHAEYTRQLLIMLGLLFFSIASYHFVSRYVVTAVVVQGRSMMPTLKDGERYILNRLTYRYRIPQRDELVVIRDPGHHDFAVKRVVGLPGETIQVKDGEVYVNGSKRTEPFLFPGTKTYCPLSRDLYIVLGQQHYFVLGDNRNNSEDSRIYGAVHRKQILGLIAR